MQLPAFNRRVVFCVVLIAALLSMARGSFAQGVPGRNVTLIGPTPQPATCATAPYCGGKLPDVGLKQQNEPSCAISPETGAVFCGANDYRGTDRTDGVLGDAWLGAMMSRNRETWVSRLIPGFKGDSPSLNLAFGADPSVAAFPGGVGFLFIAGNRGDNALGGIFFQRWVEMNKEDGYPFEPANEPTHQITSGTSGRFIDKPAMMINLLPGTCDIPFKRANGTVGTRTVPKFEVSVAFAIFLGSENSANTAIWLIKSSDCGMTWDTPGTKITQTVNINQGVSLSAIGNTFVATWRRFGDSNSSDAVMSSVSTNRGVKWSLNTVTSIVKFDQGSSNVTFRNNTLPWLANDGNAFHVFWAERAAGNLPRIRVSSSKNGAAWNSPDFVDNFPVGFQVVPSATASEGVVQVAWYDSREDVTQSQGPLIGGLPYLNDYVDANGKLHRHTIDVRAAQGRWDGSKLRFTSSVKVSSYAFGVAPPGFLGTNAGPVATQLENNFANSRIFQQGRTPFLGDYIAVAAKQLKVDPVSHAWVPNTTPQPAPPQQPTNPTFFVAWGDNRLLRGNTIADLIAPTGYTPPTLSAPSDGVNDPTTTYPACSAATPLSNTRNQEVFGTSIKPGLVVTVPSAPKPTGTIQRAYVVWVRNTTSQTKTYKVHIANQPVDAPPAGSTGRASFSQLPLPPYGADSVPAVVDTCVTVPRRSGAVKTVFVTSSSVQPPAITVQVNESDPATCTPNGGDAASVVLNANPISPDIENPDFENPDFENFNLKTVELHNPDIENKTFASVVANPDIENPDFENFTVAYPDIENPDFENPDFENVTVKYPDIENPDFENPDFENPDFENSAMSEVTWSVTMNGNTTSGLQVTPLFSAPPPHAIQLLVRRVYKVTTSQDCKPVQVAVNEVIGNTVSSPNVQPTLTVPAEPGEKLLVTLRISGTSNFNPDATGLVVTAQAKNTGHENDPDVTPSICDTSDRTQFCTSDVPKDVTPPVFAATPDLTVNADADGTSAIVTFTPAATDNTGVISVVCSPPSGSTFAIGSTTVTCTASDAAGNNSTASFNVIVKDVTPPAFGPTSDVTVVAAPTANSAIATYTPTATDAVGVTSLTCTPASGSSFHAGSTVVTCTAKDAAGNTATATFNVIVKDVTAPIVSKPADVVAEATSAAGAAVTFALPPASDAVGVASESCTPTSGSVFPLGTTTVSCSAADAAGNAGSTTFSITVRDTIAPLIGAAPNVTVTTTNTAGTAVVAYATPNASDAVGVASVVCSPPSGSTFALGATTVTCTARDAAGNMATKTFSVTVTFSNFGLIGPVVPNTANLNSVVPLSWQYTASGKVVDTGSLVPTTRILKLTSCQNGAETGAPFIDTAKPGNTDFNYKASSSTWQFNWKTPSPLFTNGCYNIYIDLTNTQGALLQRSGPFKIQLK